MIINGLDIYNRIIEVIKDHKLNNNDLYKKVGITRQHLARWKKGSLPSVDILYSISNELNISLEWLLTGIIEEDQTDPSAQYKIVERIDYYIKGKFKHDKYEENIDFYSSIKDIVNVHELDDWFCGRQKIDIIKIRKIADKLGTSAQYFLTGSNISKSEYTEKYFGNKESEDANFYRDFSSLNDKNRETIKHITALLRKEQYEKK